MCTVTFIPRRKGYCLGMNRDEKRTRVKGLPPRMQNLSGRSVLYPSEPKGGTWIAVNDKGISFALINWYSVPARAFGNVVSRGVIIPAICSGESTEMADARLAELPLERINPFRLIGVFPGSHEILEWRWDLKELTSSHKRWRAQQWISSGFDERAAQKTRSEAFRQALTQQSAATLNWLRRLHGSHSPQMGPLSICMHRDDAATVSYTELFFYNGRSIMRYGCGTACSISDMVIKPLGCE